MTTTKGPGDISFDVPFGPIKPPAQAEEPEPIPTALTAARSEPRPLVEAARRRSRVGPIAALSVGAVLVAVAVLILARESIVAAVPGAAKLYAMVGLAGEELGAGLDIRDVNSTRETTGDGEALVVGGVVANTADGPRDLPLIRVALFDADNEELQFVTVSPDRTALPSGETVGFTARLENPAATARRIKVTFAPRDESS